MIEYKNNKKETYLNLCGGIPDILSDVSFMICLIHSRMMEENPEVAEAFKQTFKEAVNNDVCFVDENGECGATKKLKKAVGLDDDMAKEFLDIIKKALGKKGGND